MTKFLLKIIGFGILLLLIVLLGFVLPGTPRASKSLLYSKVQKDSLLKYVNEPRIIFIGGSNLSFGLNSQIIKDSLLLNPINTAVHASIGLQYMVDNSLPYIQEGDIIIIAPEYSQFYGKVIYGGEELLRTIADINLLKLKDLRNQQILNISKYILPYSFSKFKPTEYFGFIESDVYSVNSFNKYGDVFAHWNLNKQSFSSYKTITDPYNSETINILKKFKLEIEKKNAILFITFPGFQKASFDNNMSQIKKIEKELRINNFKLLGTPGRYKMSENMMFNTPYHLSRKGVDYRTQLLIQDIKKSKDFNGFIN